MSPEPHEIIFPAGEELSVGHSLLEYRSLGRFSLKGQPYPAVNFPASKISVYYCRVTNDVVWSHMLICYVFKKSLLCNYCCINEYC